MRSCSWCSIATEGILVGSSHRSVGYKYSPDTVPPIHAVSYHVAMDKPSPHQRWRQVPVYFSDSLQPIATRGKKHVARYWSINTAATAVPLSAHPSPLVIITKLAATILGGGIVRRKCSAGPVLPLWFQQSKKSGRIGP